MRLISLVVGMMILVIMGSMVMFDSTSVLDEGKEVDQVKEVVEEKTVGIPAIEEAVAMYYGKNGEFPVNGTTENGAPILDMSELYRYMDVNQVDGVYTVDTQGKVSRVE